MFWMVSLTFDITLWDGVQQIHLLDINIIYQTKRHRVGLKRTICQTLSSK